MHVWHYDHRIEGSDEVGASYCNKCRVFCAAKATATATRGAMTGSPWGMIGQFVKQTKGDAQKAEPKRSAFAGLIDDLERANGNRSRSEQPVTRATEGAFDRVIGELQRESARMPSAPTKPAGREPDPSEVVMMFEEDERGNLQAVRHRVPPSRLERLTAELVEASKPPPPTAEEMRAERRRRDRERELRNYRRFGAERRAWLRACAEERGEIERVGAHLKDSCRA